MSDDPKTAFSPPSDVIRALLKERNASAWSMSKRLGFDLERLLKDPPDPLTNDMAYRLSALLGETAVFWTKREHTYREALRREMWR